MAERRQQTRPRSFCGARCRKPTRPIDAKADATNARIDDVLLTLAAIGDVAGDIEAMRADLAKLVPETPR